MNQLTRRDFTHGCLAAAGLAALPFRPARGVEGAGLVSGLERLGAVAPRPSLSIEASPLSIGFETLDRRMFDPDRTYAPLKNLGVKWARTHTGWCRTETKRGEYDFSWLDSVVDSLREIGIQPWFCVGFGNPLYSPESPDEFAVGCVPVRTPEAKAAWLRYVGRLAEHFRGRVRHFEIWNEPNAKFWEPDGATPAEYVDFVKLTAPMIRERIDDAVLIGGAVMGMNTKFFEGCMEQGMGGHIDKASFHSYRFLPEKNYAEDIGRWRAIIEKHAPGIPLWHGEVGAASQPGGAGGRADYPWSLTRQAKWMLRRFVFDLKMGTELISYFHLVDLVGYHHSDAPSGKTNYKGLLRGTDYSPKPAFRSYQCLCSLFDSETARCELPMSFEKAAGGEAVNLDEIVSAGFTRKGKALYAWWLPCGPEMERPDLPVSLSLPVRPDAELREPVLIDPLDAGVYRLDGMERRGDNWSLSGAPLADHPLFLTDRSVALG